MLTVFARIGLLIMLLLGPVGLCIAAPGFVDRSQGVIDFSRWSVDQGAVTLNGVWGMHWQQQLAPGQQSGKKVEWVDLPFTWDKAETASSRFPGKGFATFIIRLKNMPADVKWGLLVPEQSTAFRLYINNDLAAEGGIAGVSQDSSMPYSGNQLVELGTLPATVTITWHITNFHHASGGPWQALTLGPVKPLNHQYQLRMFDQALAVALAFIASLFLMTQYFIDRRDRISLILSIFAGLVALRVGITGNQPLYQMIGVLDWQLHIRLLYLSMLLAAPLVLLWQHWSFPKELSLRTVKYVAYMFAPAIASIFVLPTTLFTELLMLFQALLMAVIVIFSWSLFNILQRRREGRWFLFVGAGVLIISVLHDMAMYSQWLGSSRLWITYGLLAFLLSLTLNILYLRAKQKRHVEDLSEQLLVANKQLEARVALRTMELAEKADALEEANDKLQVLANIDGLTGVLNRRAFVEQLTMLARLKPHVALLMIDIDHFKRINDTYGHTIGDQVLKRLSTVFIDMKREHDRVGRFGGEEFMVLLQDISSKGLESYCRRLTEAVHQLDFSDIGPRDGITVSIGTTMATLTLKNIDDLIQQADEAMYQVKNSGRDNYRHYHQHL